MRDLNEIMHEHHLACNVCLKIKCLTYGNGLCKKNEETLPTVHSYSRRNAWPYIMR